MLWGEIFACERNDPERSLYRLTGGVRTMLAEPGKSDCLGLTDLEIFPRGVNAGEWAMSCRKLGIAWGELSMMMLRGRLDESCRRGR